MWLLLACTEPPPPGSPDAPDHSASPVTAHSGEPPAHSATPPGHTGATEVEPPLGGTSGGDGGEDHPRPVPVTLGSASYRLLAPDGAADARAVRVLVVLSGVEGDVLMMSNLEQLAPAFGLGDVVVAVLDGRTSTAEDAAAALDDVRAAYDVDNDRTFLLSESAGTTEGLELGLSLRQSWFAAYWANDVNARRTPDLDAAALGFAPWGNVGPGGAFADAEALVLGMADAGYQLPADAPYSGPGSGTHGSSAQLIAAVSFFDGRSR